MHDQDILAAAADPLPETIVINGVTYVRESDEIERVINNIRGYQQIAERTGLSLRQAIWFRTIGTSENVLPD